jgi:hypothetical protein
LATVALSQYFNFPGSCNFDYCALVSAKGTNKSQGIQFLRATATYSGSGTTANITFKIVTSALISLTPLYLSCYVSAAAASGSTCAINQFFVYSSSPITFEV